MHTLIPHAESADVSGSGHMLADNKNDAVNSAVIAFLDRVLRLGAARNPPHSEST